MLENPSQVIPSDSSVKRYAPPNQRNRSLGRRKSGERFERSSNAYGNDGDKFQHYSAHKHPSVLDQGDPGSANISEKVHYNLVPLEGCSHSEASQLLNDRWEAVMNNYNNPGIDKSERPDMYVGNNASAWGNVRLPHQMLSSQGDGTSHNDFLTELQRAMRAAGYNVPH